jgi:hypothetical protein
VDPRGGLEDMEKRKFLTVPGLELDPSPIQSVNNCYTDYAIPAHILPIINDVKDKIVLDRPLNSILLSTEKMFSVFICLLSRLECCETDSG